MSDMSDMSDDNDDVYTLEDEEKMMGFGELLQCWDDVAKQAKIGSGSCVRVSSYVKKLVVAKETYSKELKKISKSERETTKIEHGNTPRYLNAVHGIVDMFGGIAKAELDLASRLSIDVVDPLLAFKIEFDLERVNIVLSEKKISKSLSEEFRTLRSLRAKCVACITAIKEEEDVKKNPKKKSMFGGIKKAFGHKGDKLRAECLEYAKEYTALINTANAAQQRYYTTDLPRILTQMQRLEESRLTTLEKLINKTQQLLVTCNGQVKEDLTTLATSVGHLSMTKDIDSFVRNTITLRGQSASGGPLEFSYDLPNSVREIRDQRWDSDPNSVFHNSLPTIMKLQSKKHPDLEVPYVLVQMIDAVRELDGLKTEGIFRIPAKQEDFEKARADIDSGKWKLDTKGSPHVPACLIKAWMRDLTEVLVPQEYYAECVEMAQLATYLTEEVIEFFHTWPKINQNVIETLCEFLEEVSNEETMSVTRMGLEALATVFAPSFMSNPSDEFVDILKGFKFEVKFVTMLFTAVLGREEVWRTVKRKQEAKAVEDAEDQKRKKIVAEEKAAQASKRRAKKEKEYQEKQALNKLKREEEFRAKEKRDAEKLVKRQEKALKDAALREKREALQLKEKADRQEKERRKLEKSIEATAAALATREAKSNAASTALTHSRAASAAKELSVAKKKTASDTKKLKEVKEVKVVKKTVVKKTVVKKTPPPPPQPTPDSDSDSDSDTDNDEPARPVPTAGDDSDGSDDSDADETPARPIPTADDDSDDSDADDEVPARPRPTAGDDSDDSDSEDDMPARPIPTADDDSDDDGDLPARPAPVDDDDDDSDSDDDDDLPPRP